MFTTRVKRVWFSFALLMLVIALMAQTSFAAGGLGGIGGTTTPPPAAVPPVVETPVVPPVVETPVVPPVVVPPVVETVVPPVVPPRRGNADAVGNLFGQAGVRDTDIATATRLLEPVVRIVNALMAVILGLTSLSLFLITTIDLAYIAFPPLRSLLTAGSSSGGRSSGGFPGVGGFQGAGGFPGAGGFQGAGALRSVDSGIGAVAFLSRWVSDEAVSAVQDSGISAPGGSVFGAPAQQTSGSKSVILSYIKKRAFFLTAFGVCVILFTSTAFTDLGIMIGKTILGWITGISI